MRRLRADPDVQARRLEASRRATATPEWKKDNREKMARLRDDPQWRASSTEQLSRIRGNPETEARRLAGLRRVHSDPSFQARRIAAIRNSEAVRRAHSDPTTYMIVNVRTGERDTGTRQDFRQRYGISSTCFGDLLRGKQKSALGWRLAAGLARGAVTGVRRPRARSAPMLRGTGPAHSRRAATSTTRARPSRRGGRAPGPPRAGG